MKVIIGDPWKIAEAIDKENVTMDKVIPLGCGIEPLFPEEDERLRCAVLIIK